MKSKAFEVITNLLFVYLTWVDNGASSQGINCNPYVNCETEGLGGKVPDPEDCHNYYVCVEDELGNIGPSDNAFECDFGEYFDDSYSECEYESTPCKNECYNICQSRCSNYVYERIPDPNDCSKFYTCDPTHEVIKGQCPESFPFFDGMECTNNRFSCCDTCIPFCNQGFIEVLDPYDCESYYFCEEVGVPDESNKFECSDGFYFNSTIGKCELDTSSSGCSPVCGESYTTTKVYSTTESESSPITTHGSSSSSIRSSSISSTYYK